MPRIPWNPRNYSFGAGSNYGPVALSKLKNGTGHIGSDGLVHDKNENKMTEETRNALNEAENYYNNMFDEGYVTDEFLNYHDMIEKLFETLEIEPDYV